jgi:hypothetical protein
MRPARPSTTPASSSLTATSTPRPQLHQPPHQRPKGGLNDLIRSGTTASSPTTTPSSPAVRRSSATRSNAPRTEGSHHRHCHRQLPPLRPALHGLRHGQGQALRAARRRHGLASHPHSSTCRRERPPPRCRPAARKQGVDALEQLRHRLAGRAAVRRLVAPSSTSPSSVPTTPMPSPTSPSPTSWQRTTTPAPAWQKALKLSPRTTPAPSTISRWSNATRAISTTPSPIFSEVAGLPASRDAHRELGFSFYQQHKYDEARVRIRDRPEPSTPTTSPRTTSSPSSIVGLAR